MHVLAGVLGAVGIAVDHRHPLSLGTVLRFGQTPRK